MITISTNLLSSVCYIIQENKIIIIIKSLNLLSSMNLRQNPMMFACHYIFPTSGIFPCMHYGLHTAFPKRITSRKARLSIVGRVIENDRHHPDKYTYSRCLSNHRRYHRVWQITAAYMYGICTYIGNT